MASQHLRQMNGKYLNLPNDMGMDMQRNLTLKVDGELVKKAHI